MKQFFPGVLNIKDKLATQNNSEGYSVYGEKRVTIIGKEYRFWDPFRSKLGASILNGLKQLPIKDGSYVLYLGAAEGTTASHVSDIVGEEGAVFCVDIAPKVMTKLIEVSGHKENMIPIKADANDPKSYADMIIECDVVFQDVAQKDQTGIFLKNTREHLKEGGYGMLVIKSRSVDVVIDPQEIFQEAKKDLGKELEVLQVVPLEPFEKDHVLILCKKK
ncbi:MAG: fibrillarin-like rRNA/tRNA 2'-O-methyltransferase [Candidatus Diapherotrites archaeon]|nr:fibrillarin-like rRNA/tRNA 2'-O-methyltransferase [Candidatus Diapherotrites archaeon]